MPKSELYEVALEKLHETHAAYLVSDDGGTTKYWLPKSQCEDNLDGTFTMPVWLAKEKGFI